MLYPVQIGEKLMIDLVAAAHSKLQVNELKYPINKARGRRKKYDEF